MNLHHKSTKAQSGLALCLCAFVVNSLPAVEVFVSPSGVDTSARNGSSSAPWATPVYALSRVGGGNTVTMMDGNYSTFYLSSAYSGTLANPTIIRAQNKWKAQVLNAPEHGIYAAGSYFTFDGIKVNGSAVDGIKTDVRGANVKNCWVLNSGEQGISSHTHNDCVWENNLSEYNGTSTHLDHGFYISGTNNVVRNNVVRHNAAYGIQVYPENVSYFNAENRVYNNLVYDHPNEGGIVVYTDTGAAGGKTNYIYGNTVHNASGALEGGIKVKYGFAHITNNLVISPTPFVEENMQGSRKGANITGSTYSGWVSSGTGKYWLTSGASARGAADSTSYGPVNFFGAAQSSVSDVGFIQYTAALAADTRTLDPNTTNPDYWATLTSPATTFYVSTSGSDLADGSQATPWRTIQKAANTLTAGKTVIVLAGAYAENVTTGNSGSAGNLITFRAQGTVTTHSFLLQNAYNRIEGFAFTGSTSAGSGLPGAIFFHAGANFCQVVSNLFDSRVGDRAISWNYNLPATTLNVTATNAWVEGNRVAGIGGGSTGVAIGVFGRNHTFTNNFFTSQNDIDCFVFCASDSMITGNTFDDWSHKAGTSQHTDIIQTDHFNIADYYNNLAVTNVVFEGNLVKNCIACQIGNLSTSEAPKYGWWTFRNNIYINVEGAMGIGMRDVYWFNNLFYKSGYNSGSPILWANFPGGFPSGWGIGIGGKMYNNIFLESGENTSASGFGWYGVTPNGATWPTGFAADYNYVGGASFVAKTSWPLPVGQEAHGINGGNPLFSNLSAFDFHLLTGSPLIDHAVTQSTFSWDKERTTRPQGASWDIGPLESTAAPDTTAPSAPSNLHLTATSTSSITLAWNASTDNVGVTGYRVERCTGAGCTGFAQIATPTATFMTDSGLSAGTTYRYRVRAVDAAGNLSSYSGNFQAATDSPPPVPVISAVTATAISSTAATITWTTDIATSSQVQYGLTTSYGSATTANATLVTSHSQGLSGLTASTVYHYRVTGTDSLGQTVTSSDNTFTTAPPPDTTAPTISAVAASNITPTSATIGWTTNEGSDSQVEYGLTTGYGSTTTLISSLTTTHSSPLTGLTASTLYHYRVKSRDAAGNLATGSDNTFTTAAAPDVTAPIISAIATGSITSSSVVITWTTDEPADTQVEYGVTISYGSSSPLVTTKVTAHTVSLTGLTASTTYHFRVKSRDATGNLATSSDQTVNIPAAPDNTAPVISAISATGITPSSATITWTTDELSNSQVEYGLTTGYGSSTTLDATLRTSHTQGLSALASLTVYHYRVKSTDGAGNQSVSSDQTFTTAAPPDTTAPTITSFAASTITGTGAIVSWNTSELADTQIEFGLTTGYGTSSTVNSILLTNHAVTMSGLSSQTLYHVRARSSDAAGNLGLSSDLTFTTLDITAPSVSAIASSSISSTAATITWTTSEAADTQVEYGTTTSYGTTTTLVTALTTTHSSLLTGLSASTLYHYRVRSKDAVGNLTVSTDQTFTTSAAPDTTPPTISALTSSGVTATAATITWTTSEPATTQVRYGLTTSYGSTSTLISSLLTTHSAPITGLSASTQYHYAAVSTDAAGNTRVSADQTFTTSALPDTTAPTAPGTPTVSATGTTQLTLSWAASTDAVGVTGYFLERCTGGGCTGFVEISSQTGLSYADSGLTAGSTYRYRVRATDAAGNLSSYSSAATGATLPNPAVISALAVTSVTATGATVTWTTDTSTDTQVDYGTTANYGNLTTLDTTPTTTHSSLITGLTGATAYHIRARSRDTVGNLTLSSDLTFTTLDNVPPVISAVVVDSITDVSARIRWTTSEASDTQVEYGYTTAYGSVSTLASALTTTHSTLLTGLGTGVPNTTTLYHYRVRSKDAAGNLGVSTDGTFTTAAVPDTTPPVISAMNASGVTATAATIGWLTDEITTGFVKYGTTGSYGYGSQTNTTIGLGHSRMLSGLTPSTQYHFRIFARDLALNMTNTVDLTFTTPALPDTTPPTAPGSPAVLVIGPSQINFAWSASTDAVGVAMYLVERCTGVDCNDFVFIGAATTPEYADTGLAELTSYSYRIRAEDAAGNIGDYSATITAVTTTAADVTPPVISDIFGYSSSTMGIITWTTDEQTSHLVEYGPTSIYTQTAVDTSFATSHRQLLVELPANAPIHFRITATDKAGNQTVTDDFTIYPTHLPLPRLAANPFFRRQH